MKAAQLPRAQPLLWLTAPLHPILVHFTIGLTTAALVFDLLAFFLNLKGLNAAGWWTLAAAILVTPTTLATGIRSRLRLPVEEGPMRSFLRTHMALGPLLFGLLIVAGIWRGLLWQAGTTVTAGYLSSLAGIIVMMAVQGYLGGELVYRYGAEVKCRYRKLPGSREPFPSVGGAESATSDAARGP